MKVFFLLSFLLAGPAALAGSEPGLLYTDISSAEALRNMERICARDPSPFNESEGVEWVKARFAWIALLRLQGKEAEAASVFSGCGNFCRKWGAAQEWMALKSWFCDKKKGDFAPCKDGKKTKVHIKAQVD